jgi:hypothetical protein
MIHTPLGRFGRGAAERHPPAFQSGRCEYRGFGLERRQTAGGLRRMGRREGRPRRAFDGYCLAPRSDRPAPTVTCHVGRRGGLTDTVTRHATSSWAHPPSLASVAAPARGILPLFKRKSRGFGLERRQTAGGLRRMGRREGRPRKAFDGYCLAPRSDRPAPTVTCHVGRRAGLTDTVTRHAWAQ